MRPDKKPQDEPQDDYDAALEEALGEEPRAAELRRMRAALLQRRARFLEDLKTESDAGVRDKIRRDLEKLDEQINVLAEEAQITSFIEDAVRVGLEMRRMNDH